MKFIGLLAALFASTVTLASSPSPVIWEDSTVSQLLTPGLDFQKNVYIISGSQNPLVTPVNAPLGSMFIRYGATPGFYVKQDAGSTTNWLIIPSGNAIGALTGDVVASGNGSVVATIQPGVVTNAKLANMAANSIKGNNTGAPASALDLTVAQVNTMLGDITSVGALDSQVANANGLALSGNILSTQSADATHPGLINLAAQTLGAGTKTLANIIDSGLTASTVPYADAGKQLVSSAVTPTELGYVSGVTSAIQTQLNGKVGSVGALDGQAVNAQGLAISGNTIYAQSADATHPGEVNTAAQTFSGVKTMTAPIVNTSLELKNQGFIQFDDGGVNSVQLSAPAALGGGYDLFWPTTQASTPGYVLANDSLGQLSWASPGISMATLNGIRANNLASKEPAFAVSTVNIAALNGVPLAASVDNVDFSFGGILLLRAQTDPTQNGLWNVNPFGAWTRDVTMPDNTISCFGALVSVEHGGTNFGDTLWISTCDGSGPVNFNQVPTHLASAHIYVGNASGLPADVPMSGDVAISNTGATTIQNSAVTNAKMANMASNTVKANITGGAAAPSDVAAVSTNTASSFVVRDGSGNFSAGSISAALLGNASTSTALAANPTDCGANTFANAIDAGANLSCASIPNAATTATSSNTNSAIVARDGSGNFSAGTITAALTGTASGNTTITPTNHGVVISGAGNAMTAAAVGTAGQVMTSNGNADPSMKNLPYVNFYYTNSVSTSVANSGSTTLVFGNSVYDQNSLNGSAVFDGTSTFTAPFAGKFICKCAAKFSSAVYVGGNEIILTLNKNGSNWSDIDYLQVQVSQNSTYKVGGVDTIKMAASDTATCSVTNSRTGGATTLNGNTLNNYFNCSYAGP